MTIGSFTLIRNEAPWIAANLLAWLPYLDEMVLFDGNSEDGTLEIIEAVKREHPEGSKITLVKDKDPKDLQADYVRLFDECLRTLSTDLAAFLHPDMIPSKVPELGHLAGCVAASMRMRSFAGEPGAQLYEIKGRGEAWKNVYRLRNPDLGAHYFGHYGHSAEDVYFSEITGAEHAHHGSNFSAYPYEVVDSGIEVLHFSDVRPYARRLDRMKKCLANQGNPVEFAELHPRVTLQGDAQFSFVLAEYPASMLAAREKYSHLERSLAIAP